MDLQRPRRSTLLADAALALFAAAQNGVFSRQQAKDAGFHPRSISRRVCSGAWRRVFPDVYRVVAAPETLKQKLSAACLWAGPEAVISHAAAARLWGLDGLEDVEAEVVEITVPVTSGLKPRLRLSKRGKAPIADPAIRVHRASVLSERRNKDGLPVTNVARTLLDLASVLTPAALELAVASAFRRRMVQLNWLRRLLRQTGQGKRGIAVLARVLDHYEEEPEAESALEARAAQFFRRRDLPKPVRQLDICNEQAHLVARVDFAFPEQKLAVELEGYRYHSSLRAWAADRDRHASLAAVGWRVLPITWHDLKQRPQTVLQRLKAALRSSTYMPRIA